MKNLVLLDVSSFIHAGLYNKRGYVENLTKVDNVYYTVKTPIGGAKLILDMIEPTPSDFTVVACFDSNSAIKKEMIPGYKGNRQRRQDVDIANEAVMRILTDCGVTCVKRDGYEADDIIYSYWKSIGCLYDSVFIYTADSDLYFMVNENTEIMPSMSTAKHVTVDNYHTLKIHGRTFVYNTITLDKIINGDKTDCIPPLSPRSKALVYAACDGKDEIFFSNCGDKNFLLDNLPAEAEIQTQIHNVFPIEINASELDLNFSEIKPDVMHDWHLFCVDRRNKTDFNKEEKIDWLMSDGCYLEED